MKYQYAQAVSDLEVGDLVEIDGEKGYLWDIRMIQTIREPKAYFQYRLKAKRWVGRDEVTVLEKFL